MSILLIRSLENCIFSHIFGNNINLLLSRGSLLRPHWHQYRVSHFHLTVPLLISRWRWRLWHWSYPPQRIMDRKKNWPESRDEPRLLINKAKLTPHDQPWHFGRIFNLITLCGRPQPVLFLVAVVEIPCRFESNCKCCLESKMEMQLSMRIMRGNYRFYLQWLCEGWPFPILNLLTNHEEQSCELISGTEEEDW